MFLCNYGSKPIWIAPAKVDPTLFNLKGMRTKQYIPHGVMNEVFSLSSLDMMIWWYPECIREGKQIAAWSGIHNMNDARQGKWVFGQALLRYVKSIQSLHFPLAFRTTTGFSNQVGCSTPLTKPVASSFLISSAINYYCRCFYRDCVSVHLVHANDRVLLIWWDGNDSN